MDVRLPRLGEEADSGTVAGIFVKVGDEVKKDQPILELESEKAVASIPSPSAGVISKIYVKEGDTIKVGQLIVALESDGKKAPAALAPTDMPAVDEERVVEKAPEQGVTIDVASETEREVAPEVPGIPPPASPSVRRIAKELGIDLRKVPGSERGGRIVMEDLRRYVKVLQEAAVSREGGRAVATRESAPSTPEHVDFSRWGPVVIKKGTTLRRTISNRMSASWSTIPHVTQFDEADITSVMELRKKYGAVYEAKGGHLTLTTFVLKAVVAMLTKHPVFNSSLDEATGDLVVKQYYNIGIAVDTDQGLIVPVIRDVDKKSMLELAVELQQLAERTRQRKLSLEEMLGGTFTISNQGGIGSAHFTPIIHKPEVAILGIGRGVMKPVVVQDDVVGKLMLPLGLSYDHRVIDGADAARFMVDLVRAIEKFGETEVQI
jgi:pyruvate dehydrogenase E2 component (dihydrolipoamide acetyltransferase)